MSSKRTGLIAVGTAVVVLAVAYLVFGKLSETGRADTAVATSQSLGQQVADACTRGDVSVANLCVRGAEVAKTPDAPATTPVLIPGPAGRNAEPPSVDLLLSLIRPLIPAPVPGLPGMRGADSTVPGPPGQTITGPKGEPCSPTDPACRGLQGERGADSTVPGPAGQPGPAPTGTASFQRDPDGACTYAVPYTDGRVVVASAPDSLCAPPVPHAAARPATTKGTP